MVADPEEILFESTAAGLTIVDVSLERLRWLRATRDEVGSSSQCATKQGLLGPQWQRPELYDAIRNTRDTFVIKGHGEDLEQPGASAVPFTQYRLLHDFGWEESGKNARQALKRTLLNLKEARWEGEVNDSVTGRKTHEDHFGIIDRVLWPVVSDGRLERLGYIFLGSWFLEQLRAVR